MTSNIKLQKISFKEFIQYLIDDLDDHVYQSRNNLFTKDLASGNIPDTVMGIYAIYELQNTPEAADWMIAPDYPLMDDINRMRKIIPSNVANIFLSDGSIWSDENFYAETYNRYIENQLEDKDIYIELPESELYIPVEDAHKFVEEVLPETDSILEIFHLDYETDYAAEKGLGDIVIKWLSIHGHDKFKEIGLKLITSEEFNKLIDSRVFDKFETE